MECGLFGEAKGALEKLHEVLLWDCCKLATALFWKAVERDDKI